MYSTIQEAWNTDITEMYSNNFNNQVQTIDNNNYFNIHENYKKKPIKTISNKKTKVTSTSTKIKKSVSTKIVPKYKKKKMKCKEIINYIKKCKKCRIKIEKYINKNKIVIDMNPIEIRKMLLCLILLGMIIILFNMLTDKKRF